MTLAGICLLKVSIETLEQMWNIFKFKNKETRRTPMADSVVYIDNFEHILQLVLVFLLLTLSR